MEIEDEGGEEGQSVQILAGCFIFSLVLCLDPSEENRNRERGPSHCHTHTHTYIKSTICISHMNPIRLFMPCVKAHSE